MESGTLLRTFIIGIERPPHKSVMRTRANWNTYIPINTLLSILCQKTANADRLMKREEKLFLSSKLGPSLK